MGLDRVEDPVGNGKRSVFDGFLLNGVRGLLSRFVVELIRFLNASINKGLFRFMSHVNFTSMMYVFCRLQSCVCKK